MTRSEAGKLGYLKSASKNQAAKAARIAAYELNPNKCKTCEKVFSYENRSNKFCSHSCSAKVSNFGRKRAKEVSPRTILLRQYKDKTPQCICEVCTAPCYTKFCSFKCQQSSNRSKYITSWLAGNELGYTGKTKKFSNYIRTFLLAKSEDKCSKCGWDKINEITGKAPLEVDHIDGDAENCTESNLQVLCPNCHSLTPNFRNLNKGKSKRDRSTK